jgi:Protein of unknown function (DUF2924)
MSPVFRNSNKEDQVRAEVETLRSLGKGELRARWTKMFGKVPPPALTKDLLGRMIAWRIQEQFYGGHDKATLKLLDWPAPGSEDTELGVFMRPEVSHGATKVYAGIQA